MAVFIKPASPIENDDEKEALIRYAIRREYKLQMTYIDVKGDESERLIWPLALGFFEEVHVIVAWCELRLDFRHFRTDRFAKLMQCETRYPHRSYIFNKKVLNKLYSGMSEANA